ncbi:Exosome complex component RRP43, partial [Nibea albiflora]
LCFVLSCYVSSSVAPDSSGLQDSDDPHGRALTAAAVTPDERFIDLLLTHLSSFQKENCRPDGRELTEFRTTTLNIGSISTADGSALVKIGNTTVICGIKAELANPPVEAPGKGYIVPNVDLPPLCSSRFRPGPPGEQAQAASQFIADVIESSELIRTEDLCIDRGKLCWVLYCDLMCLDYDGNVLDACVIALLAALKNTQLPEVTFSTETCSPQVNREKRRGLHIHKHPVSASLCVFDDSILIVDPTAEEESLTTSQLTVVTDEEGRLCAVHKPGGTSMSAEKLQECISRAVARQREIQKLINKVIHSVKAAQ